MALISLIIPTYNEAATIGPLLARIETVADRLSGHSLEVVVVDDSPDDATARAVNAYRQTDRLPVTIHRRAGRGLATAVLHGFTIGKGDLLAVIDADHSHPPELLVDMVTAAGEHDLVVGTRNAAGGRVEEWPAHRKLGSRIVTAMTRVLGVRTSDPMSGYFLLRRRVIDDVTLSPLGYKILLEILVKGKHTSVHEIPYVFRNRAVGVSKMNARVTLEYFVHFGKLAHEKHDIARFVAHIAEIGSRDYHLKLGYQSLFEYCVKRFNLTEGSVYRRTQVAGVCHRFPQLLKAISQGRLHLTGASLIAPHLADDNVERLIAAAQEKSKRELEKLLVTLAPKKPFVPSLRKQPARDPGLPAPEPGVPAMPQERPEVAAPEMGATEATPAGSAGAKRTSDLLQPATEDRYNVRFSAGSAFTEKLTRLAEVLGIERPQDHLEEILTRALEIALEKRDPQRKLERRREREARKESPCPGKAEEDQSSCRCEGEAREGAETSSTDPAAPRRHVPAAVRERVLERAGYRCEYRGRDGTRCSSRTGLQVEHTLPFAVYGTHEEKSLRAFCPAHNLLAAREFYGREFIRERIDAARGENVARCAASAVP